MFSRERAAVETSDVRCVRARHQTIDWKYTV